MAAGRLRKKDVTGEAPAIAEPEGGPFPQANSFVRIIPLLEPLAETCRTPIGTARRPSPLIQIVAFLGPLHRLLHLVPPGKLRFELIRSRSSRLHTSSTMIISPITSLPPSFPMYKKSCRPRRMDLLRRSHAAQGSFYFLPNRSPIRLPTQACSCPSSASASAASSQGLGRPV